MAGETDESQLKLYVPIDTTDNPEEIIDAAMESVRDDEQLLICATDVGDRNDYAIHHRVNATPAPWLLDKLETYGDVHDLALMTDKPNGVTTPNQWIVARTTKRHARTTYRPDVVFFCPVFAESWGPWRILREGCGGSEESVIYLARELANRGLRVEVYAPLDRGIHRGVHVEDNVRWHPLDAFDTTGAPRAAIATIAHRAPWATRMPCFDLNRLYIWHQDAWYTGGWTLPVAEATRSLWVSRWQRKTLLSHLGVTHDGVLPSDRWGVVCGDGIPEGACRGWEGIERNPKSCVYLSSPIRGLMGLLDVWPYVIRQVPDATLDVYYGWETLPPGMARIRETVMRAVAKSTGVRWRGRVPQATLEAQLPSYGVWLYPTSFPEGFCIAGVRATAAGCVPAYSNIAALPEVQIASPYSTPDTPWADGGRDQFARAAVEALGASVVGGWDREGARDWAHDRHLWSHVADRVVDDFKERGLTQ
jgi:glycosyltransferase involved in cell wall biosynthesis